MAALKKAEVQQRTAEVIYILPVGERAPKKGLSMVESAQLSVFRSLRNFRLSSVGRDTAYVLKASFYTLLVGAASFAIIGGLSMGSGSAVTQPTAPVPTSIVAR